ncbi:MAG: BCCT family transporter [Chitinophagales bacterium]
MSKFKEPGRLEKKLGLRTNPTVFWTSALLILFFVLLTLIYQDSVEQFFTELQLNISQKMGWFYILAINFILVFAIYLGFSKYKHIRIGGQDSKPEFSFLSWFAMLFNAGIGLALMFYSIAEPILHYSNPPYGTAETTASAQLAMGLTFLHWGFHGWAVYAIVGLSVAFFAYNKGMPLSIRSVFYPIIGERIYTWIGDLIDIIAVVATLFGLATTLGLGIKHISAGLFYLFDWPQTPEFQVFLIMLITLFATISVVLGLQHGIRRLSILSSGLILVLMLFMLIAGPTLFIVNSFVQNLGFYLQNLPELGTWSAVYTPGDWQAGWTIFYWGWWFAWAPFVGIFIARISRGRNIREFIFGVLLAPTLAVFVWITVFGSTALHEELYGAGGIVKAVNANLSTSMYVLLERFPLQGISSVFVILAGVIFFVTSSDSGSLVVDFITTGGQHNPPKRQRIFWALIEGIVASVLVLGGGLIALQTGSLATGVPVAIVLLFVCFGLKKGFDEYLKNGS